jgi:hypothetical protein
MRLVIATPLYPPDIAEPAPYVKQLARELSRTHEVTVVLYGKLPEVVDGVRLVAIDKGRSLPFRLVAYTRALIRELRSADCLYIENGASVELPAILASWLTGTPLIVHQGDAAARRYAAKHLLYRAVERGALARARACVTESPLPTPEILPLAPRPERELEAARNSWRVHLAILESLFTRYGKK